MYGTGCILQWHARLVHSSGVNFGHNVRMAAIMDFRRSWPSSQLEWMVRTREGHLTMRVKGREEYGEPVGQASARVRDDDVQSILPSLMWHHDVRRQLYTAKSLVDEKPLFLVAALLVVSFCLLVLYETHFTCICAGA